MSKLGRFRYEWDFSQEMLIDCNLRRKEGGRGLNERGGLCAGRGK